MEKSIEQKEAMFDQVMGYIIKSYTDEPPKEQYTITKTFLEELTQKSLDEDFVLTNNEELTKSFGHITSSYGFNDFYDLYQYSVFTEEEEQVMKGGQKDLSKLKKVKRNVVRNGKQTTMTFYEDPNGKDSKTPEPKEEGKAEEVAPEPMQASELQGSVVGEINKPVAVKDLKLLSKLHSSLQGSKEEFNADCDNYLVLRDEEQTPKAIVGFKVQGKYLHLAMADSDNLTTQLETRAFYELIKLSLARKLGASLIPKSKIQTALAEANRFKFNKDIAKVEYKTLYEMYGDL